MEYNSKLWNLVLANDEVALRQTLKNCEQSEADLDLKEKLLAPNYQDTKTGHYYHTQPNNPVHLAAYLNQVNLLKAFLDFGVDVDMEVKYNIYVYCAANNARSNYSSRNGGETLLHAALRGALTRKDRKWDSVELLLERNADINKTTIMTCRTCNFAQDGRCFDVYMKHVRQGHDVLDLGILSALQDDDEGITRNLTKRIKVKPELERKIECAKRIQQEIDDDEAKIAELRTAIQGLKDEKKGYVRPHKLALMVKEKERLDKLLDAVAIANECTQFDDVKRQTIR